MEFPSWEQALVLCSQPGIINAIIAMVSSFLIEYAPGFKQLHAKWKVLVFAAISIAVPVAAAGLGVWTLGWTASWATTWWSALQAGMLAFMSGSGAHLFHVKAKRAAAAERFVRGR